MTANCLIKNVRIIDAHTDTNGDVLIEDGKITAVGENLTAADAELVDGTDRILMPGLIDPHVHFREPGFEYKEDLESGSRAALYSGVTCFFDMPNTDPPTFTRQLLAAKKALAEGRSHAHYGFYFGAGPDNQEEIEKMEGVPGTKLYLNTTTGNLRMDQESRWREIFQVGKKVALHAEGDTFHRAVTVWLEEGAPCELHLCHASLRSEVELVRSIKDDPKITQRISMEVCPHHLFMTHKEREKYGAYCCMKPELATEDDLAAMWEGVADGTIDCFATDHAPHTVEEKESDQIYFGIPGVETFFPLLFNEFQKKDYDLKKFSAMTSYNTFEIFNVADHKGLVKEGYDADLVLINPKTQWHIKADALESKCKWTPFHNWDITGKIEQVWLSSESGREIQFH
jgi:dihydroorotase